MRNITLSIGTNMSAPVKKRAVNLNENEVSEDKKEDSASSDEYSEEEGGEEYAGHEEIQVEFEGRSPIDSDFHGIKQLLNQLFLKAHLNVSELAELIIGQNYVGSVVKQSEPDEEDSDDDDSSENNIFGVTTVLNLTEKQKLECITQLRTLLVELCAEHGSEETISLVKTLLASDHKPVGLIINERFVNIPPQIAVPLLKSLSAEMKRAVNKKMPFEFSYLILICKLYKIDQSKGKKKGKKGKKALSEQQVIWSNAEEEIIEEEAEAKFEFSVEKESDSGVSGQWSSSDSEMTPYRRVLIIPAAKLDDIVRKVEEQVAQ